MRADSASTFVVSACRGLDAYCHRLFAQNQLEGELVHLIDAVTTNKTDFFREPEHFEFLRREAVPRILAQRGDRDNRPLKVWSAACSNGAEPFTLGMVLSDLAAARAGGAETLDPFCERTRGQRVSWPAVVVESRRQFGDDYMESGLLLLDVDAPADGRPDVVVDLRPSQVKAFARGQGVTIDGVLRGCELQGTERVLRIEPVEIG